MLTPDKVLARRPSIAWLTAN